MQDVTGKQPPNRYRTKPRRKRKYKVGRGVARGRRARARAGRARQRSTAQRRRTSPRRKASGLVRSRRGSKKSFLLELALRALKRLLKQNNGAPTRNHGFKGVRKPNKTGLAGR